MKDDLRDARLPQPCSCGYGAPSVEPAGADTPVRPDAPPTTPYRQWQPASPAERRRHPRNYSLNEEITYTVPGIDPPDDAQPRYARCYDASRGGMFIWGPTPLPIGEVLEIRIGYKSYVRARVVWHRHTRQPELGRYPGMGVAFLDIDPRTRETLELKFSLESPEVRAKRKAAQAEALRPIDSRPRLSILHAHEDQDTLVRPLAAEIARLGGVVQFEDLVVRPGDSLTSLLGRVKAGVVVVSPAFLANGWATGDLDSAAELLSDTEPSGGSFILPLWHQVTRGDVAAHSPALADHSTFQTSVDLSALAKELHERVIDRLVTCGLCGALMANPGDPFGRHYCDDCCQNSMCG